jgi:8-oxo-dGTP pyrophosphatase MutT (NUDIX family)
MESTSVNAEQELISAAVLIPLLVDPAESSSESVGLKTRTGEIRLPLSTQVLLTVRTNIVEHHKGQISFPGGRYEPSDSSLEETALRETLEEIGIGSDHVEVVAELPEIPTVATRYKVRPYVGVIRTKADFRPDPHEVEKILLVPLKHLLDPKHSVLETYERAGLRVQMRAYHFDSHRIWGATGRMLQTLLERFLVP